MANENEQAQEEVVEQEEQTSEEEVEDTSQEDSEQESTEEELDTITLSKADFKKLNYKAKAYDATKSQHKETKTPRQEEYSSERLDRLELKADGYSSEEIDAIMDLGGIKSLEKPLVQKAIKAMRAEQKSNEAKVSPNSKSPVYKKFTQEDLNKMSSEEMEKVLRGN